MIDKKEKTMVGTPYKYQHNTSPSSKQLEIKQLFLVSAIKSESEIIPIFIVEDPTFGIRHFNIWKIDHGFAENLARVDVLPFIKEIDIEKIKSTLIIEKLKKDI